MSTAKSCIYSCGPWDKRKKKLALVGAERLLKLPRLLVRIKIPKDAFMCIKILF